MTFIPKLDTITSPASSTRATSPNEVALRQAAAQFEALLLTQLTASLNPKDEGEEEDGLFGNSGGGMGLSRQMYSEQLAKTMSQSGGIGIADMIMAQVTKGKAQPLKNRLSHVTERALSAAPDIKNETVRTSTASTSPGSNKVKDLYPDAIIISEASPSDALTTRSTTSASSVSSPLLPNDSRSATPVGLPAWASRSAIGATRPRRVHAMDSNATVLNGTPAIMTPRLAAATSVKNPMVGSAYVSFHAPVNGEIRSPFGMRRDPINGRMRFHQGIDIAAKRGTPIEAAAAGTVVFAGRNKGYGKMVMIEHADGRRTLYGHAQSLFVKAGDTVAAGQTIAAVGSTGHSTGPHLHFEVRQNNRSVNPLTALSNDIAFARR
jgi:murein DD-endopeptidase MepM/ murein hydrolase activator NlpD